MKIETSFTPAQDKLTTLEYIPILGIIPSAIQVILSIGELIAAAIRRDSDLAAEGAYHLGFGLVNILTPALVIPFLLLLCTCCNQSSELPAGQFQNSDSE